MTVSEYIFDFLQKKGLKTVFMVSGSSAMWLTDALKRNKKLEPICCHHEQAASMAADGYGRVNNTPGACLVTIGPGATNAITGVAEAFLDSSAMFVISGQASSKILQYQMDSEIRQKGTQSINLEPMVSSITKYFAVVMRPEEIQFHMEKAYYESMNGRKGPVWIDVPIDIQNRQIPDKMEGFSIPNKPIVDYRINEISSLLKHSSKPLILAGNGIRSANAVEELKCLSEEYNIPVVTSRGGIDVIESKCDLYVGRPGSYGDRASHFAIQSCDLLLILGSRLSVSTIGYYPERFAGNAKKIMVDIDRKEVEKKDVPIDICITGDVKDFLKELLSADLTAEKNNNKEWVHLCHSNKIKYPNVLKEYAEEEGINSYYFTNILSEYVKEDTNIVVDTGSVCNIVSQSWNLKKNQRYLISGGLSCMGFWASAIGISNSSNSIIALTGDGSAQMNIQELATIKFYNMPIKLFIYNNNGYMLIRHNQHNYMNDRFLGVGPDSGVQTPNFTRVAAAYGIKSIRIDKKEQIHEKIKEALECNEPVVCEIIVQEFGTIAPKISSRVMLDGSLKAAEFDDLWPFLEKE